MLYQVIGVERKTGDFTPKDEPDKKIHYDNIVFHCVTLKRLVGCAGQKAEQCAIKVVDSADMLGSVDARNRGEEKGVCSLERRIPTSGNCIG